MFGAIQIGIMAACIVVFVPMAMAGWHLSRNKMLFFSCALFITLAVCVHLTPFFPSSLANNLFSSSSILSPMPLLQNPMSCISHLHQIAFDVKPSPSSSNYTHEVTWDWSTPLLSCNFHKLDLSDASDLLNGSWIVVAGDSQARFIALSLLSLVLKSHDMESVKLDLFKRHSNYQIVIPEIGMKLDFIWAPFVTNLTKMITEIKQDRNYPDVMVMGSGLWHMLHVANESDYGASLRYLRKSLLTLSPRPHLFWLGMPSLINAMLSTKEKKERMNRDAFIGYDREVYRSKILLRSGGLGGGPLLLLDMKTLSRNCGARCTTDGIHYHQAVYEAAVHVMLNALLIQSHQKL